MVCMWFCLLTLPLLAYGENWQLQERNVCFGARGSQYGTFTLIDSGLLRGIQLVHTKGQVTCRHGRGHSSWGCGGKDVSLAITTDTNKIIFPGNLGDNGWIKLPKYSSDSSVIVLDNPAYNPYVEEGQKLRLWFGEDLKNSWDEDNSGKSCADVYANIERDAWILQQENVCFGAKDNEFGTFQMIQTGTLHSVKMVHKSGWVACWCKNARRTQRTHFGCNRDRLATIITDQTNSVVFPSNMNKNNGFYKLPPYTPQSNELVLDNPTSHNYHVTKGQEMRIWYGEDLKDDWEGDNCGTSCVDVYAKVLG